MEGLSARASIELLPADVLASEEEGEGRGLRRRLRSSSDGAGLMNGLLSDVLDIEIAGERVKVRMVLCAEGDIVSHWLVSL